MKDTQQQGTQVLDEAAMNRAIDKVLAYGTGPPRVANKPRPPRPRLNKRDRQRTADNRIQFALDLGTTQLVKPHHVAR